MNKVILPITIVVGCLVLGGFYYATQIKKQESIEKQQKMNYAADRKKDCLLIYKAESEKWDNVLGWHYFEPSENIISYSDVCEIEYKDAKTGESFSKFY